MNKGFKRIFAIILMVCITVSLVACGGTADTSSIQKSSSDSSSLISDVSSMDTDSASTDSKPLDSEDKKYPEGVIKSGENTRVAAETTVKNFGLPDSQTDAAAADLRKEILEAKDTVKAEGTTYYISCDGDDKNDGTSPDKAWKSLNMLTTNAYKMKKGDAVLLRRGDIFRGNIDTVSGVSYGAYGTGDKPSVYGCKTNYAEEVWRRTSEKNIYAMIYTGSDVGTIVFNHGEGFAKKKMNNAFECDEDYEFYYDSEGGVIYLYCSKGKPSDVFYDIEFLYNKAIFYIKNNSEDVKVENICFKYTGGHAVSVGMPVKNISIKNCEIGWVGGSIFRNRSERYGNGIQFYGQTNNAVVDHCWVYQCYDAGLTHQYSSNTVKMNVENISYTKNLVECCAYSFEYFWGWKVDGNPATDPAVYMKDIKVEDSIFRFAGYGICTSRPDTANIGHIVSWKTCSNTSKNFCFRNNIFDTSTMNMFNVFTDDKQTPVFSGNTYIQKAGGKLGNCFTERTKGGMLALNDASLRTMEPGGNLIIKK